MKKAPPPPDTTWIEHASKSIKPKRKPVSVDGPCVKAIRKAQAVLSRLNANELTRAEADRLIGEIVKGVE